VPPEREAHYIIGLGLQAALARLLPALPRSEYGRLAERYREHFLARDHTIALFPGILPVLSELRAAGFVLAVATGKSRTGLDRAFLQTGIGSLFDFSRCADESFSKPHPGMLYDVMNFCGALPERTLMIGDTSHDLQMAANAGVAALAVGYGAHAEAELLAHGPLDCAGSVADLAAWLTLHA
jgi:phosphoglycolate phosphatase